MATKAKIPVTHMPFSLQACSLDQVWVTGREEKKLHTLGLK